MPVATQDLIKESNEDLPDVVKRGLAGDWPKVLRGPEIVDVLILIEYGLHPDVFRTWRKEEEDQGIWEHYLDPAYTATLETLRVADIEGDEHGCAEQEHAEYFATLTTKAPPIFMRRGVIVDGNHRFEAANIRGDEFIDVYIITENR
jgi:hypothetical protein